VNILIDLQSCQSGSRLGGIGRYTLSLVKAMASVGDAHNMHILLNGRFSEASRAVRSELRNYLPQRNIISFDSVAGISGMDVHPMHAWPRIAECMRETFAASLQPDIFLTGSLFEGLADDVVTSIPNKPFPGFTSSILYDLIPYVQQDKYLINEKIKQHYFHKLSQLPTADLLLAISEYTRSEAITLLGLRDDQVVNISGASTDYFQVVAPSRADREEIANAFGISGEFILYTSSFDVRKNQATLVKAFAALPHNIRSRLQLVIVGNGWPEVYEQLRALGREHGVPDNQLVFTGKVTDKQMLLLYNMAYLFVFPSFYEGFGLPILEAMACGTPAIGSNTSSVVEVIGRLDALFDPHSPQEIAQLIVKCVVNKAFYHDLQEFNKQHIKTFTWEHSAKRALDAFNSLVQLPRKQSFYTASATQTFEDRLFPTLQSICAAKDSHLLSRLDLLSAIARNSSFLSSRKALSASGATTNRLRLGIVTTWGTRCGIAEYSKMLVSAWPHGTTHVFANHTPQTTCPDPFNVTRCWTLGDHDDLRELLGAVAASNIRHLLIQLHYGFYSFEHMNHFVTQLVRMGVFVSIQLHSTADPPPNVLRKKLETLIPALRLACNVFVLSERDYKRLQSLGVSDKATIVPLGVPHIPRCYSRPKDKESFILSSYGYFLPHKGLLQLLKAIRLIKDTFPSIHLQLINAEYPAPSSAAAIADAKYEASCLGLEPNVTFITDYLTDEESGILLAQSDLIVLPYQETTEPTSAAVRLPIATGVPVAVTPSPIFDDVRTLVHTLPGFSVAEIAEGVTRLIPQIKASSATVVSHTSRAELWALAHSYRHIAGYLAGTLYNGQVAYPYSRIISHWKPSSQTQLITNSHASPDSQTFKAKKGQLLLHGPYISLEPGSYCLRIFTENTTSLDSVVMSVRLTHNSGAHVITPTAHPYLLIGSLYSATFTVTSAINNFEIAITAHSDGDVVISNIVLEASSG
jgi:glycosyltransferase involved in cell wall biosynthesis